MKGSYLFLLMWKANHAIMKYDGASIREQGFDNFSDFAVLEVLLHKGALPVNTIGDKVKLTTGSITTAVQRLEKKGWVLRERQSDDARVVLVHLTKEGAKRIQLAFEAHEANLEQLFEVFSEKERTQFAQLIKKVGKTAESINQ